MVDDTLAGTKTSFLFRSLVAIWASISRKDHLKNASQLVQMAAVFHGASFLSPRSKFCTLLTLVQLTPPPPPETPDNLLSHQRSPNSLFCRPASRQRHGVYRRKSGRNLSCCCRWQKERSPVVELANFSLKSFVFHAVYYIECKRRLKRLCKGQVIPTIN